MLEVGKESMVGASAEDAILRDAEDDLIAEAMGML